MFIINIDFVCLYTPNLGFLYPVCLHIKEDGLIDTGGALGTTDHSRQSPQTGSTVSLPDPQTPTNFIKEGFYINISIFIALNYGCRLIVGILATGYLLIYIYRRHINCTGAADTKHWLSQSGGRKTQLN